MYFVVLIIYDLCLCEDAWTLGILVFVPFSWDYKFVIQQSFVLGGFKVFVLDVLGCRVILSC